MKVVLTPTTLPLGDAAPVEVVERKGLGHPDTICDALAEEFGLALSRFYLDRFGVVLHHNVDKALLVGGAAEPAFGGGRVITPFAVMLAGRAVREFQGITVPVEELALEAGRAWLAQTFRCLDLDHDVTIRALVRPGSVDLQQLFERTQHGGVPLANDTSCGAGHAPHSTLERLVLTAEQHLNSPAVKDRLPGVGEDIKVMGVRHGTDISLTVSCAQIDRHLPDLDAYRASVAGVAESVRAAATQAGIEREIQIAVNTGDDLDRGQVFLTVTGTSAEAGDDGEAGRGNRIGGLITPHRAMTMESAAGKNPITHVGKLYNALARDLATAVVDEAEEVTAAQCHLVSQIGRPISDPQLVQLEVSTANGAVPADLQEQVQAIAHQHLDAANTMWKRFLQREIAVY